MFISLHIIVMLSFSFMFFFFVKILQADRTITEVNYLDSVYYYVTKIVGSVLFFL